MRRHRWLILGIIVTSILLSLLMFPAALAPTQSPLGFFFRGESEKRLLEFETLEIARTPQERNRGFMERTDICDECGMLFIFDQPGIRSFWMQNTPTSLDILFIQEDGRVVVVHENTVPFQTFPTYSSAPFNVRYVLEAKAGYANFKNIDSGDYVDVQFLIDQGVPHSEF